jgi:hypothetical protein
VDFEKLQQKKVDLEAEKIVMFEKISKLEKRIRGLEERN